MVRHWLVRASTARSVFSARGTSGRGRAESEMTSKYPSNWSQGKVAEWFAKYGLEAASQNALRFEVNGEVLLDLEPKGWEELGVESSIMCSK